MNKKLKILSLILLLLIVAVFVDHYFKVHPIAVLNPSGPIAQKEKNLMMFGLLLSLIIVGPLFTLLAVFSWKYRASNTRAKYSPNLDHSRVAETIWWLIPAMLILVISVVTWNSSYALDPFKPVAAAAKPLTIQVVAEDWKWLFIYPKQNIATVNYVHIPVNVPVTFEITSDSVMNSFWIPQLAGQMYAMPGMSTQLNVLASKPGSYRGSSANISGKGFAAMSFMARATSTSDFTNWVKQTQTAAPHLSLTAERYTALTKPSVQSVATYAGVQTGLYDTIVMKYMMPMQTNTTTMTMPGMGM